MNLAKNFLKTITRLKDSMKVRRDTQRRNIKKHLWLTRNPWRGGGRGGILKPATPYVLSEEDFNFFANCIEEPEDTNRDSSSLEKHIRKKKLDGLKSHDYHMLMQQVLPLALCGLMKPGPRTAIMRMCKVFCWICTKVHNPAKFKSLEEDVVDNMALL
jgi:hypothetical protein